MRAVNKLQLKNVIFNKYTFLADPHVQNIVGRWPVGLLRILPSNTNHTVVIKKAGEPDAKTIPV